VGGANVRQKRLNAGQAYRINIFRGSRGNERLPALRTRKGKEKTTSSGGVVLKVRGIAHQDSGMEASMLKETLWSKKGGGGTARLKKEWKSTKCMGGRGQHGNEGKNSTLRSWIKLLSKEGKVGGNIS